MTDRPFDWEAEERRDSERFYKGWHDGPNPSDYMDYPEDEEPEWIFEANRGDIQNPDFEDKMPWVDESRMDDLRANLREVKDEYVRVFVTERHENDALLGCVVVLATILLALMFWIWAGTSIMRWVL